MALEFTPLYHFKNPRGVWQLRPFDPKLASQAVIDEAKHLTEAGESVAPVIDEGPGALASAWLRPK